MEIFSGRAEKAIVDGQIPLLNTLQALSDSGAVCSAAFDPVTKLETDGLAVPAVSTPLFRKSNWWLGQWNDFLGMIKNTGFWTGLVVAVLLMFLLPLELGGLAALGVGTLIGLLAAFAATVVANVWNGRPSYTNLLRGMLLGAGAGLTFAFAASALVAFEVVAGSALFVGAMAMAGAGIGIILNKLAGQPWDKALLANAGLAGAFAALGKFLPKSQTAGESEAVSALPELERGGGNTNTHADRVVAALKDGHPHMIGNKSFTVIEHEDGTVSVGVSGCDPARTANAQELVRRLNSRYADDQPIYRTIDGAVDTSALLQGPDGAPEEGVCSEAQAAQAAGKNLSPPKAYQTIWGGEQNPHPMASPQETKGGNSVMKPCATCQKNVGRYTAISKGSVPATR